MYAIAPRNEPVIKVEGQSVDFQNVGGFLTASSLGHLSLMLAR